MPDQNLFSLTPSSLVLSLIWHQTIPFLGPQASNCSFHLHKIEPNPTVSLLFSQIVTSQHRPSLFQVLSQLAFQQFYYSLVILTIFPIFYWTIHKWALPDSGIRFY